MNKQEIMRLLKKDHYDINYNEAWLGDFPALVMMGIAKTVDDIVDLRLTTKEFDRVIDLYDISKLDIQRSRFQQRTVYLRNGIVIFDCRERPDRLVQVDGVLCLPLKDIREEHSIIMDNDKDKARVKIIDKWVSDNTLDTVNKFN